MFSKPKSQVYYACLLILFFAINSCGTNQKSAPELDRIADSQYTQFVSSYTSDKVSSRSKVTIQLAEVVSVDLQKDGVLTLKPSVKGTAKWLTNRVLEFTPSSPLMNGETYTASLDLETLEIEEAPEVFTFQFDVIDQDFDLRVLGLMSDEADVMRKQIFQGELVTADVADTSAIKSALSVKQGATKLDVEWTFDKSTARTHQFQVRRIEREEEASQLIYNFNGVKIGVGRSENERIDIPALNDFKVLESRVLKGDDAHVLLSFSDPLDENQDLNGFITVEGDDNIRYAIDENQLKIYTTSGLTGDRRWVLRTG